ncbi:hypothetical protein [Microbacterium sp. GCS4]|uniref:hypothetical protein n=1 Tax=Microbacterium sp. GCS4 TaxID=1692239 RepID=UPI000680DA9F|nr:hypothetical protein [Microbacterium sp. GCS4]KNY07927.1 hypothetical protein AKH00_06835 [Microbacterium sp. GCS4]
MNTTTTAEALTELTTTALDRAADAQRAGLTATARKLTDIGLTLDSARTRLIEDGEYYLDTAIAFVDAGRNIIAAHAGAIRILGLIRASRRRG